ncbi:MAG TPA: hypothetical protein VHM92_06170 [Allosphingosinicella sp.]|nr:hypothetical protein [Allosphingosinicella sp.]
MNVGRVLVALAAPLFLMSCVLSPGRFVSSLDIRKDRSFTFSYAGEVILLDPANALKGAAEEGLAQGLKGDDEDGDDAKPAKPAEPEVIDTPQHLAEAKAIAEALSKEVGYQSVEYVGNNKFRVDYRMTGRLDRSFIYPINVDAKAIIPWIAIEVRKDGTARVMALAFGDPEEGMGSTAKPGSKEDERQGSFTLTTDAELVMHNNEEGKAPGPGTKVVWKVTAASRTVPTAVVRF